MSRLDDILDSYWPPRVEMLQQFPQLAADGQARTTVLHKDGPSDIDQAEKLIDELLHIITFRYKELEFFTVLMAVGTTASLMIKVATEPGRHRDEILRAFIDGVTAALHNSSELEK